MNSAHASSVVAPAHPDEWEKAFQLIFQSSLGEERRLRVRNALRLLQEGDLDRQGILVLRGGGRLLGAMICQPTPGASALVWPPETVLESPRQDIEDQLLAHALRWLRQRGSKLAQTLLLPEEKHLAASLLRHGFDHVTDLWYLRHDLHATARSFPNEERLTFQDYPASDPVLFRKTLERTYEGTQDFPEINGVRDLEEVLEGHQAQSLPNAVSWWLALDAEQPVGVLLLAASRDWNGFDVSYLGVIPEARRRGIGRALAGKALAEARLAGAELVTLAVDGRNRPAWDMYLSLGFEPYDCREAYLAIWKKA